MLRSELYELEKSVGVIIEEISIANFTTYQQQINGQVAYVKSLCSELKKKWTHELLSNAKEQVIKRYIQFHQAGIIQLSDKVSLYVSASDLSPETKISQATALSQLNNELENVLEFLRTQFYLYFDIDHKAPIYHCQLLYLKISTFRVDLENYKGSTIDEALIAAVLSSADDLTAEGLLTGISYRQADQAINIVRATQQLLLFGTNPTTDSLIRALYQQNFNSLHFYNWYQDHLLAKVAAVSDKNEQQALLEEQIKMFAGVFVNAEKALLPELSSTDKFILPWLQEKLNPENKRSVSPDKIQMPLNLSVPQFALFVRVFYKTGCFPIENVALITRFFTEHFVTKKQPHISPKSFGRAFYNLDQSAAAIVRDFLQKMINYINKTYFP